MSDTFLLTAREARKFACESSPSCNWDQWLKCNGTQGNAVSPPPIYGSKRSPASDCYGERHTTIVRGPNLNVAFSHPNFCTLTTDWGIPWVG